MSGDAKQGADIRATISGAVTGQVAVGSGITQSQQIATVTGAVSAVEASYAFTDSSKSQPNGYFSDGTVTFTSGANIGLSMEVRDFTSGRFGLFLPMPNVIAVGDTYTAVAGCDKLFDSCVNRFNNAVNFRGEPHVPGTDKLLETSATRNI